jgi:hypothetical protein
MRILISITIVVGACFVVLVGLLSVVHDLLIRVTNHVPRRSDRHVDGREQSPVCPTASQEPQ